MAVMALVPIDAPSQDDVVATARATATSGRRAEALTMLETHLATTPRDVDARLLYGLVLSWEGRYDEARPALQQVLLQAPGYTDARVALMNVEYWSGHSTEARELADRILADEPGNDTARVVRERLTVRPWWAMSSYTFDSFNDGRDGWHELAVSLTRRTPIGSAILRASHSNRYGLDDQLLEAELYPRFRPGSYAFISGGVSTEHSLYPQYRVAFDMYQSVGRGFEASAGARYLQFESLTQIYVGTVSKYWGNWMFTGKMYYVPADDEPDSVSYYGGFRRYFGGDGTSYVGATYGQGLSREEIRSIGDLAILDSHSIRGELDRLLARRLRYFASAGTSREERVLQPPLWQTTISAGLYVQF
jgi:YaiO family outer membrane protein